MKLKLMLLAAGVLCVTSLKAAQTNVVTVTAYCACKKCCGPNAKGITASGKKVQEGVTIAASRSIPFGTKIQIPGLGVRVVQDRLATRFDNRIDVYMDDHTRALKFGKKTLTVVRL